MPDIDDQCRSPLHQSVPELGLHSPTITSALPQGDNLGADRSQYAANTGGRAHHPRFANLQQPSNFLQPMTTTRKNTTIPTSSIIGSDEPRSFFDSDTDSGSDDDAIISRASSVRVQRPQLIQHHSAVLGGRSVQVYGSDLNPASARMPQHQGSGHPARQANHEDTSPRPSIGKSRQGPGTPLKYLSDPTPGLEKLDPPSWSGSPAEALEALTANAPLDASIQTLGRMAPSAQLPHTPPPIAEAPITLSGVEVSETAPSPMGGLGTFRMPGSHEVTESTSPKVFLKVDGLRQNPVRNLEIHDLHRATSAPPLPSRHPHRKVTIRPHVEVVDNQRLRPSVIGMPYPRRNGSVDVSGITPLSALINAKSVDRSQPTNEEKDRFPSPLRAEMLLLELSISRHPSLATLVQVEVKGKSSYDDEALFQVLRKSYTRNLVGRARRLFSARAVSFVTFSDANFDALSFMDHFNSPKLGRQRRSWLIWLREQQLKQDTSRDASESGGSIMFHSPRSMLRMPFSKFHKPQPRVTFHFEYSPWRVGIAVVITVFLSAISAIFWILFGLPGIRTGQAEDETLNGSWQHDAQGRVLTGLILGILVAVVGSIGNFGWIFGSWVVL